MNARRTGRFLGRVVLFGVALWALTLASVAVVQTTWHDAAPPPRPADAILCLGAGAYIREGRLVPDAASARRAQTCAALHAEGVAPLVVFTGGLSAPGSAAAAMADLAALPAAAVVIEGASLSTIQNAGFSLALLPEHPERIVVVSDAFHLPRAWLIFRAFGVPDVALYAASAGSEDAPQTRSIARWVFRESFAVWFNAARAATYVGAGWLGVDETTRLGWFN